MIGISHSTFPFFVRNPKMMAGNGLHPARAGLPSPLNKQLCHMRQRTARIHSFSACD
jgi:hypothetical protein